MVSNEGRIFKHSQIITDTVSATYENRLRIIDKSSETAGTYTCEIRNPRGSRNESLYIKGESLFSNLDYRIAIDYDVHYIIDL